MDRSARRTPSAIASLLPRLLLLPALMSLAGCTNYHWSGDPQHAEQVAKAQHRYVFIFYKNWLSNDSNRMHGDVLTDPQVAVNFQDTVNLLIDSSCPDNVRYMSKYNVSAAPAFVLVAPSGDYQVRTGFLPKEEFIEFVQTAKASRPERRTPRRRSAPPPAPAATPSHSAPRAP